MTQTFDLLSPVEAEVADPSVTPDIGNSLDMATIVARLDELTEAVSILQSQLGNNKPQTDTQETETETETETESETEEQED